MNKHAFSRWNRRRKTRAMLRQVAVLEGVILDEQIQQLWLDEMDRAGVVLGDYAGRRRALTRAVAKL